MVSTKTADAPWPTCWDGRRSQGRVIVSHDSDFGKLAILQNKPLIGVVFLRPSHIDLQLTIDTIQATLTLDPDVSLPFVVVAKRNRVKVRIRALNP